MRITKAMADAFEAGDRAELRRLLNLKPWQVSPLDVAGPCPHPSNTGGALSWPHARALREELLKAGRKQRLANVRPRKRTCAVQLRMSAKCQ